MAPGDRFCSECGARVAPPDAPRAGGAAETKGPGLAARTDAGRLHPTNQDAFVVSGPEEGGVESIVVVCDGVSNSQTPEAASATAARVAHEVLRAGGEPGVVMREAILAAHAGVCALPFDRQAELDPPATTIVAAWVHAGGAVVGWLGDSRAYWFGKGEGRLLTRDHSWMAMVLDRGEMTVDAAERDARAHALLHCLGTTDFAGASPCAEPGVVAVPEGPGWLVLCSDGLWNYADAAGAVALAAGEGLRGDAADLCSRLVAFALASGGRDNVTVAAVRVG